MGIMDNIKGAANGLMDAAPSLGLLAARKRSDIYSGINNVLAKNDKLEEDAKVRSLAEGLSQNGVASFKDLQQKLVAAGLFEQAQKLTPSVLKEQQLEQTKAETEAKTNATRDFYQRNYPDIQLSDNMDLGALSSVLSSRAADKRVKDTLAGQEKLYDYKRNHPLPPKPKAPTAAEVKAKTRAEEAAAAKEQQLKDRLEMIRRINSGEVDMDDLTSVEQAGIAPYLTAPTASYGGAVATNGMSEPSAARRPSQGLSPEELARASTLAGGVQLPSPPPVTGASPQAFPGLMALMPNFGGTLEADVPAGSMERPRGVMPMVNEAKRAIREAEAERFIKALAEAGATREQVRSEAKKRYPELIQ